jgi:hypothetical protein
MQERIAGTGECAPMPKRIPQLVAEPPVSGRELRYFVLRILASSHDLWEQCPHGECRRARRCADPAFTCLAEPLAIDVARFLDWYG